MPDPVQYAPLETPIGRLWLAATAAGILAITRGADPEALLREVARRLPTASPVLDVAALDRPQRQLAAYFDGAVGQLDVPIDLTGVTAFDAAIWKAVQEIPRGITASYGEVASAIGSPRATRAVGGALARCPLTPLVPCHRVIRADGSLGGWGADRWVKRWLLDLEAATSSAWARPRA